ncbi:hypothetical protein Gotur_012489, partial [Gossypium turneri]
GFQAGITKHQDIKTLIVCHILDVTREVVAGVTSMEAIVIATKSNVPVGFEPVSIAKSKIIALIVKYMSALSCCSFILIRDLVCKLQLSDFLTVLNRSPNFLAMHFLALPASVVRLTGAGDCLVGGILASLSTSLDMIQSVAIGIAAAKASVEVDSNVPSQFSFPTITGDVMIVYSAAKLLQPQSKL